VRPRPYSCEGRDRDGDAALPDGGRKHRPFIFQALPALEPDASGGKRVGGAGGVQARVHYFAADGFMFQQLRRQAFERVPILDQNLRALALDILVIQGWSEFYHRIRQVCAISKRQIVRGVAFTSRVALKARDEA